MLLLGCIAFVMLMLLLGVASLGLWEVTDILELMSKSVSMGFILFLGVGCIIILGNFLDKIF